VNLLFARVAWWEADSKIESWEQSKQTKEGVLKQAMQAGLVVTMFVISAKSQGVNWPAPTGHLIRSNKRWRGKRVSAGLLLWHLFPVATVNCLVGN